MPVARDVSSVKLPITVLVAARNEAANIARCLAALDPAERVILLDSQSTDATADLALAHGAEVVNFHYTGGYPKKRQWAMATLPLSSPWLLLIDADEEVTPALWQEIRCELAHPTSEAYLIVKEFHFMGRRMRWGGFSHAAVLLFRRGCARFEHLLDEPASAPDMEVHERLLVDGRIARLHTPLRHEDFKGLDAYRAKHVAYANWEARVRHRYLTTGSWGAQAVTGRLTGNLQERRRFLKSAVTRLPGEPACWFLYHYFFRLGFLEGRRGWIACCIRANYIARVRAILRNLQQRVPA